MKNRRRENGPALDLLKRLYKAAGRFREAECWSWMWDSDLFGVRNPADGTIYYCSIMGRNGDHFALAAYTGTEGLKGYFRLREEYGQATLLDAFISQTCLSVAFEERELLDEHDRRTLRRVGHHAVGPHPWPQIRSYSPGLDPWYVSAVEAELLIQILEQAQQVALRFKDNPDLLGPPDGGEYLVRVPERGIAGLGWKDEWIRPDMEDELEIPAETPDEVRLARIRQTIPRSTGVWEIDCFYAPGRVVGEGGRPYFPRLTLCVDHDTTMVLGVNASAPAGHREEFSAHVMDCIEQTGVVPSAIMTGTRETARMLDQVASVLGIDVELSDECDGLKEALEGMLEHFGSADDGDSAPPVYGGRSPIEPLPDSRPGGRPSDIRPQERPPTKDSPSKQASLGGFPLELSAGFDPSLAAGLIHAPFDPEKSPLVIRADVDDASFGAAKLLDHVSVYMDLVRENEPVKLTQKGNLPLRLVRELRDRGVPVHEDIALPNIPLRSEEDAPYINMIDVLSRMAGLTKNRHRSLALTAKYKKSFQYQGAAKLYRHLLEVYATKYNWAVEDGYDVSWLIQRGFGFSLFLVQGYGTEKRFARFYSDTFSGAFPSVLEDFDYSGRGTALEDYHRCYYLRVLKRFMLRFGLIDIEEQKKGLSAQVLSTDLFGKIFAWDFAPR